MLGICKRRQWKKNVDDISHCLDIQDKKDWKRLKKLWGCKRKKHPLYPVKNNCNIELIHSRYYGCAEMSLGEVTQIRFIDYWEKLYSRCNFAYSSYTAMKALLWRDGSIANCFLLILCYWAMEEVWQCTIMIPLVVGWGSFAFSETWMKVSQIWSLADGHTHLRYQSWHCSTAIRQLLDFPERLGNSKF